jgi:hypothetical protein
MHAAGMFGSRYMLFIPPYLQSNILFSSQAVMSVVSGALMIGTFSARAVGPRQNQKRMFFPITMAIFDRSQFKIFCASSIRATFFHLL